MLLKLCSRYRLLNNVTIRVNLKRKEKNMINPDMIESFERAFENKESIRRDLYIYDQETDWDMEELDNYMEENNYYISSSGGWWDYNSI